MTVTAYLLLAGTLLAGILCLYAALPAQERERRPLPFPPATTRATYTDPFPTTSARAEMTKEGRHHADDLNGETVNLAQRRPQIYRDPR